MRKRFVFLGFLLLATVAAIEMPSAMKVAATDRMASGLLIDWMVGSFMEEHLP